MFKKLKQKWKVGPLQLVLILCTFAIGGSLSGYGATWCLSLLSIDNRVAYTIIYIIVVTALWPLMVLLVGLVLGQFSFFSHYLKQLFKKIARGRRRN